MRCNLPSLLRNVGERTDHSLQRPLVNQSELSHSKSTRNDCGPAVPQEISINYNWLRPVCEESPSKAPCRHCTWCRKGCWPTPGAMLQMSKLHRAAPVLITCSLRGSVGSILSSILSYPPLYLGLGPTASFDPLCYGQVPSGFYLADALLLLDKMMEDALLIPHNGKTKQMVAGDESKRLKRLVSALRHLYRNCFPVSLVSPRSIQSVL